MRIFVGTMEIASCLNGLATGFEQLGHSVTRMVTHSNRFYADRHYEIVRGAPLLDLYDYSASSSRWVRALGQRADDWLGPVHNGLHSPRYLLDHDLFVFMYRPWWPEWALFPLLKRLGKKVVYYCLGSDVRHVSAFHQQYQGDAALWERLFHNDDLNAKIRKIRAIEEHCDLVYSVPDQAGLAVRPYHHVFIPMAHTRGVVANVPARDVPLVIHAPSRSGIKGTPLILAALDRLKAEGVRFDFRLLENVPNHEVLGILSDADIVVDEVLLHGPGSLGLESMAAGCAVATRYLTEHDDVFAPPVCPILPETIGSQVRRLVTDKAYRVDLAHRGPDYVRDHNDPARVAGRILADLAEVRPPDYTPDFYLERYVLPAGARLTRDNRRRTARVVAKHRSLDGATRASAARRGLIDRANE